MLAQSTVFATIAVKDIEKAKVFYGQTLGLTESDENPGGIIYKSGNCKILIYESGAAGTNQATYAAWEVDDIEAVVNELKAKAIIFEHYDIPGATLEGDIHIMGPMKAAWFKDPEGNILNVVNTGK